MHTKALVSALRKALQVYNPGLGNRVSDEVVDCLVGIYGLEGVEFPSIKQKRAFVTGKCDDHIEKALERLG